MAHSLRSKPKLRAKAIKRGGEFQNVVDERQKRIVAKCAADLKKQNEEIAAAKEAAGEMAVEVKTVVKSDAPISTSGWRETRHTAYKKRNNTKSKKHMKFGKVKY